MLTGVFILRIYSDRLVLELPIIRQSHKTTNHLSIAYSCKVRVQVQQQQQQYGTGSNMTIVDSHKNVTPQKTWGLLTLYWTVGWIVGLWKNNFSFWITPTLTPVHLAALTSTLVLQHNIIKSFGRRTDYMTVAAFAIGKGLAETMFLLASYEYGRFVMANQMELTTNEAIAMGFWTHLVYRALAHLMFWAPSVFPLHLRPNGPPI